MENRCITPTQTPLTLPTQILPLLCLLRLRTRLESQRLCSFHGSLVITQFSRQIRGVPVFHLTSSQQLLFLFLTFQL